MKSLPIYGLCAALAALATVPATAAQVTVRGLPASAVQISPCVAGMGEHWADPRNLPFGPIYGVYDHRVVFTEVMIDRQSFLHGKNWRDILRPLPGFAIDHVDIAFNPHGHEGYPVPHYDLHAYFVPHAVHEAYCPHGLPNPEAP